MWLMAWIRLGLLLALVAGCEPADPAQQALEEARLALQRRDYPLAAMKADEALQLGTIEADVHMIRGHAMLAMDRFPEALQSFDNAIQFDPNEAEAYIYAGLVLEEQGNPEQALEHFAKAYEHYDVIREKPELSVWSNPQALADMDAEQIRHDAQLQQVLIRSLQGRKQEALSEAAAFHANYPDSLAIEHVMPYIEADNTRQLFLQPEQ